MGLFLVKKSFLVSMLLALFLVPVLFANAQQNELDITQEHFDGERQTFGGVTQGEHSGECLYSFGIDAENCINIFSYVAFKGLTVGVSVAGQVMDKSFEFSVRRFAEQFDKGSGIGESVKSSWEIFRDLANIIFIFILLYAAILTILGSGGDTKKIIGRIVIVAILINFSFFLSGIVIDISNRVALQFYNASGIENSDPNRFAEEGTPEAAGRTGNFGQAFLNAFSVLTLYNPSYDSAVEYAAKIEAEASNTMGSIVRSFFGITILLVSIFVFLAAAFILLARFIILVFLLLISPIAFIASILPNTNQHFKKWMDSLLSQSFYAPVFFLFLWVTLRIVTSKGFTDTINTAGNFAGQFSTTGLINSLIGVTIAFVLGIGMLLGSIIAGKKIGGIGASTAMSYGIAARKWGQGVIGRNTIGRGGRLASRGFNRMTGAYSESGFGRSKTGRTLGSLATTFGGRTLREGLKKAEEVKFGSGKSLSSIESLDKSAKENYNKSKIERNKKERIGNVYKAIESGDSKKIREQVGSLSPAEIDDIIDKKGVDFLTNDNVAHALTSKHIDKIKDSDKYSEDDKKKISDAYKSAYEKMDEDLLRSVVKEMKPSDAAKLPEKALVRVSDSLSKNVLNQMLKDGSVKDATRQRIRAGIENAASRASRVGQRNRTNADKQALDTKDWLDNNNIGQMF